MQNNIWENENLIKVLKNKGVAVMPTDTIYGIVGEALDKDVVERIYNIKGRNPDKPCIILIGDIKDLERFSIYLTEEKKKDLEKYWSLDNTQDFQSKAVSIVLDCENDSLEYLHRGTNTLAFRLPFSNDLRNLLIETGPLIVPSANTEATPPSVNIEEAKRYFEDLVDLYIDGGELKGKASKLIKLNMDGSVVVLRE
ncbi:MAG: L-threonylcarbamoyladenylate synthase [Burkholderiales bacterium]|nr:L-threonylcarbamoyladenylate synthase [Burkholderiales bacterium]